MLVPTSDGYRRIPGSLLKLVCRGLDPELEDEPPNPDLRLLATPLTKPDAALAAAFFAMFTKELLIGPAICLNILIHFIETIYNTCHTKVDTHQPNPKNIRVIHRT
jgi:hypothetical protein